MSYKEKLASITTFIFDFDGVFTDGEYYLFKDELIRTLNSRDTYALRCAIKMGFDVFVITGSNSEEIKRRLLQSGVKEVILWASNKEEAYEELKSEYNFTDEQVLYMGDDIPDYYVMKKVGIAACPKDAAVEIKEVSDYISINMGGHQCVRDVVEQTLRAQGKWFSKESHTW